MIKVITIFSCLLFISCFNKHKVIKENVVSPKKTDTIKKVQIDTVKQGKNTSHLQLASFEKFKDSLNKIEYPIEVKLPFGSKDLINYSFPERGFSIYTDKSIDPKMRMHQEKFLRVINHFTKLETPHPDAEIQNELLLYFEDINYIELGNDNFSEENIFFNSKSINSVNYRFQNINDYEVYFKIIEDGNSYQQCDFVISNLNLNDCCYSFDACRYYGFLIFYDPINKNALIANLFYINSEDSYSTSFRFSIIKENGEIKVFEAFSNLDSYQKNKINTSIIQTNEILINNNQINLETFHDYDSSYGEDEATPERKEEIAKLRKSALLQFIKYNDSLLVNFKPIISKYPFGAIGLIEKSFPKKEITQNPEDSKSKEYLQLSTIWNYYFELTKPIERLPYLPSSSTYKKVELSGINNWNMIFSKVNDTFLDPFIKNIHFSFKLPNIKNYEVYYLASDDYQSNCDYYDTPNSISLFKNCGVDGYLFLHDKDTETTHVINAYSINSTSTNASFRFFHIDELGTIHIYEGFANHDFHYSLEPHYGEERSEIYFNPTGKYKLKEVNTIKVLDNGNVSVN